MTARPPKLLRSLARRFGFDLVPRAPLGEMPASGDVVSFARDGATFRFFVCDPRDEVQAAHADGRFYEEEELRWVAERLPRGGVFLDVGANVGNHAVFAAAVCGAARVICVEPSEAARLVLRVNLALNDVADRAAILPVAVSDAEGEGVLARPGGGHLGMASLRSDGRGERVRLARLDAVAPDGPVDLVKIDVEDHEVAALRGAEGLLRRARPAVMVEVAEANREAVAALLDGVGYAVVATMRRYSVNENWLAAPVAARA